MPARAHEKSPARVSGDSGPVAAQPARAPIATASSAMNNHLPLCPISEDPIRWREIVAGHSFRNILPEACWREQVFISDAPASQAASGPLARKTSPASVRVNGRQGGTQDEMATLSIRYSRGDSKRGSHR